MPVLYTQDIVKSLEASLARVSLQYYLRRRDFKDHVRHRLFCEERRTDKYPGEQKMETAARGSLSRGLGWSCIIRRHGRTWEHSLGGRQPEGLSRDLSDSWGWRKQVHVALTGSHGMPHVTRLVKPWCAHKSRNQESAWDQSQAAKDGLFFFS